MEKTSTERYVLEHELRRGSMGSVWQAYDRDLQRKVAVKFMQQRKSGNRDWNSWFRREALAIARLQHANIIQVFDVGVDEHERPFIVMELLEGEDLAMRLRRVKQLPLTTIVPIVAQVAKALDAAHARGVLHRDLKPANIFLARQGSDVVAKILDFGVAALLSSYDPELDDAAAAKSDADHRSGQARTDAPSPEPGEPSANQAHGARDRGQRANQASGPGGSQPGQSESQSARPPGSQPGGKPKNRRRRSGSDGSHGSDPDGYSDTQRERSAGRGSSNNRRGANISDRRVVGTPGYMSPEQATGNRVDYRSDLWSLAVVAYEAITGQVPFHGDCMLDIMYRICSDPIRPPSELLQRPPRGLDAFFARALAKNAEERFPDGRTMAAAFAQLLQDNHRDRATKVLIIDDEPDMEMLVRQTFRRKIRSGMYEFLFARNGVQALELLQTQPDIELAVTDINMPVMNGFAFLQRVESISPIVRTIVVSAYGNMDNIRQAMNFGAFDFLIKPIDFQDFEATLEKGARQVRELRGVLHTMAENQALRMLVAPPAVKRLLPFIDPQQQKRRATETTLMAVRIPTTAGVRMSPDTLAWLNACFDTVASAIGVFGGCVLRFYNSTLIAEFGGAQPIEDAVSAGLRIKELLAGNQEPTADTIIAIAVGPLLSASLSAQSLRHVEHTEIGDPLDTIMRMVLHAPSGHFLVPDSLGEKLPDWCTLEPLSTPLFRRSESRDWRRLTTKKPRSNTAESLPLQHAATVQLLPHESALDESA